MNSKGGNRMTTLDAGPGGRAWRGRDGGSYQRGGPKEAKAVNDGVDDGNGLINSNIQIANFAAGFNNGSQDGNGFILGLNTQIGNVALGLNNGSQDGNGVSRRHQYPDRQHRRWHQQRKPGRQWRSSRHQHPAWSTPRWYQ